jgi:hypothetical protein
MPLWTEITSLFKLSFRVFGADATPKTLKDPRQFPISVQDY